MLKTISSLILSLFIVTTFTQSSHAQNFEFPSSSNDIFSTSEPLKPEDAFNISEVINEEKNQLKIIFDIEKEHYIYEKDLSVYVNGFSYNNYIATSEVVSDEFYGDVGVIKNSFSININNYNEIKDIQINYRGCSPKFNICYPTQKFEKTYNKDLKIDEDNSFYKKGTQEPNNISVLGFTISYDNLTLSFLIIFLIGIFVSFTPCVLPMIPIVSSLIISQNITKKRVAAYFAIMYVIGTSISYGLIGALTTIGGISIQSYTQTPAFIFVASILLIVFSLTLFDIIKMPNFTGLNSKINDQINKIKINGFTIIIIGFLSSLIISPCVAAPLASILIFTTTIGNPILSFLYLFIFGIGSGLILILIAANLNRFKIKSGSYMTFVKYFMGFLLLIISLYLLDRIIDQPEIIDILYTLSFIYFAVKSVKDIEFRKLSFLIFIILLSFGRYTISEYAQIDVHESHDIYETININSQFEDQPTFIKVSADWCIYCKELERDVYSDPNLSKALEDNYVLLKLDISDIEDYEQNIMNKYNVISAPAFIIINKDGGFETHNGSITKESLLEKLKAVNK